MIDFKNLKISQTSKGITRIILNDPSSYNSLSGDMIGSLLLALDFLNKDSKSKVIIIEGSGKGFSAGHNLKEINLMKNKASYLSLFKKCSKLMLVIRNHKKPIIAKIHGGAFAAGCQLVASCDLAYSTKDSIFATPGVNIGLFCSTPMVALSRNVNRKESMQMLLTGEPIKANSAKSLGVGIIHPNGIVVRLAIRMTILKKIEISQIGSVVDNFLIVIVTKAIPVQKTNGSKYK